MRVKKSNGKIFGANLSAAEKKALDMEISRQLAEYSQKYEEEIEAVVLLMLRAEFGFGEERLKRAHRLCLRELTIWLSGIRWRMGMLLGSVRTNSKNKALIFLSGIKTERSLNEN